MDSCNSAPHVHSPMGELRCGRYLTKAGELGDIAAENFGFLLLSRWALSSKRYGGKANVGKSHAPMHTARSDQTGQYSLVRL